jgi:hypothetical protein
MEASRVDGVAAIQRRRTRTLRNCFILYGFLTAFAASSFRCLFSFSALLIAKTFSRAWSRAGRPFLLKAAWRSLSVPGCNKAPMESAFALLLNLAAHSAIFGCHGGGVGVAAPLLLVSRQICWCGAGAVCNCAAT